MHELYTAQFVNSWLFFLPLLVFSPTNITTEISAFVAVLNNVIITEIIDQRKNSPQMRRFRRCRFFWPALSYLAKQKRKYSLMCSQFHLEMFWRRLITNT